MFNEILLYEEGGYSTSPMSVETFHNIACLKTGMEFISSKKGFESHPDFPRDIEYSLREYALNGTRVTFSSFNDDGHLTSTIVADRESDVTDKLNEELEVFELMSLHRTFLR